MIAGTDGASSKIHFLRPAYKEIFDVDNLIT